MIRVFQGEVGDVGVVVDRAGAGLADLDLVLAVFHFGPAEDDLVVEAEEVGLVDLHFLGFYAVDEDGDGEVRRIFAAGLDELGERLRSPCRFRGCCPSSWRACGC